MNNDIKNTIRNSSFIWAAIVTALGLLTVIYAKDELSRYLALAVTGVTPLCAVIFNLYIATQLQKMRSDDLTSQEQGKNVKTAQNHQSVENKKGVQKQTDIDAFKETPPLDPKTVVCQLLTILQKEGRFVDFLQEDIEQFDDAQIGAAARQVHGGCREALKGYLGIKPVIDAAEGSEVEIDADFDPSKIKLMGKIKGKPPYRGIVMHPGWRFSTIKLPDISTQKQSEIITPAEVEIS